MGREGLTSGINRPLFDHERSWYLDAPDKKLAIVMSNAM